MKNSLKLAYTLFVTSSLLFTACNDEMDAGPGESETYIKLYGSQNNEVPNDMLLNADGSIIILATQEIVLDETSFKIKVLALDQLGNLIWENSYPQNESTESVLSYKGGSIIANANGNGYLIIGESINADNQNSVLILEIDQTGTQVNSTEFMIDNGNTPIAGVGLALNSQGEIKATGLISSPNNNLWVGTFSSNLELLPECSFRYASAVSDPQLLKSTFTNSNDEVVFGLTGFQTTSSRQNGKLVKVPSCQPIPLSSPFIVNESNSISYATSFITKTSSGFAMVGTRNPDDGGDIFISLVNSDGVPFTNEPIVFNELPGGLVLVGDEEGFSIEQTNDGGYLIGGSSESNSDGGSDIILIKTNPQGVVQWHQFYGDQNDEEANILMQSPDGGYLILGNTEFGGINTLILIKTDRDGNVI
ncbi:hypothetical protein [Fulvivirga lutea]|uniref:Bulb-type lectin domain-containing protein n=1 Tax=Fulvivirga lutea TaxID=2810512 RepID=A0A974ZZL3_9BACT|nr:hypothetical protein [Fulvivirga lutea]QSE96261.1 hypothetical protein JR347_11640 [Fulvivirga lutea]